VFQTEVNVIPRASRNRVSVSEGKLKIHLTAPPVDGAANTALRKLLAEVAGIRHTAVEIVRGHNTRRKLVRFHGITAEEFQNRIKEGENNV